MELDALGFAGKIIPYFVVSAAIAAIVAGLRRGFRSLEESKILSSVVPLVLGALAGYYVHSLAPKDTETSLRVLYGILAGSFSAPVYHAFRRVVASKLKGDSKRADAGYETTFANDISAPKIKAERKPREQKKQEEKKDV
jgi:hypothetical protein